MASQGSGVPFGFCIFCGGRRHEFGVCPSRNSGVTTPLCFRCGQQGHLSLGCRRPVASTSCDTCRGVGHFKNACIQDSVPVPTPYKSFKGSHCFCCGGAGHYETWCASATTGNPLPRCYKCGSENHTESHCTSTVIAPKCSMCQGVAHVEKDCGNIAYYVALKCDECGQQGHVDRDCPEKSDEDYPAWKGYNACATCGQDGHFMGTCTNYITR